MSLTPQAKVPKDVAAGVGKSLVLAVMAEVRKIQAGSRKQKLAVGGGAVALAAILYTGTKWVLC